MGDLSTSDFSITAWINPASASIEFDTIVSRRGAGGAGNEVHSVVGDMLLNIGMGAAFIMFLISISIFLIQKKII